MSFKPFIDYLSLEKNYSPNTITAYQKDLDDFLGFCTEVFDEVSIDQVNYSQVRSWIVKLVEDEISNRSVNRKIASLKAYYKFLLKTKQISVNPLAKHRALKTPKKVQVPFSENEMEKVHAKVPFPDSFEGKRDKLIIELLYATGMRRSELVGLKTTDVDYGNQLLKVLGKRNKERYIPLIDSILEDLEQYDNERAKIVGEFSGDHLLLTKKGVKIYDMLVYRVINEYFAKASEKVKKSPHILRHTFATHMLNKGADLNAVKELLGHASLASTQIYTHNSIAKLKEVYDANHPRSEQ